MSTSDVIYEQRVRELVVIGTQEGVSIYNHPASEGSVAIASFTFDQEIVKNLPLVYLNSLTKGASEQVKDAGAGKEGYKENMLNRLHGLTLGTWASKAPRGDVVKIRKSDLSPEDRAWLASRGII